jgi:hypothetical protein
MLRPLTNIIRAARTHREFVSHPTPTKILSIGRSSLLYDKYKSDAHTILHPSDQAAKDETQTTITLRRGQ